MKNSSLKVALLGNSNVGKSTLFNTLTKSNQKVINAPGTTVSVETGVWGEYELIDLPGLISMFSISPDEEVAAEAIMHKESIYRPNLILLTCDAMHLSRGLYLLSQAKNSGIPIIFCITMSDLAQKHNINLDESKIKEATGVSAVIKLDARSASKADELYKLVKENIVEETPDTVIDDVKKWAKESSEKNFDWVIKTEKILGISNVHTSSFADKIDRFLLNKFLGPIFFLLTMLVVFQVTTTFANPFIDFIDDNVRDFLTSVIGLFSGNIPHWLTSLLNEVIIETVVTVGTFLPPMFFMFISLAVLENSGYLSRAAFVADRLMRTIGLDGRSLLPIITGYGCNLPAIASTKALPDSKSRLSTGLLIPYTLCSARLAVFVVLAHIFFAKCSGLIVFLLYLISIILVIIVGAFLNIINKSKRQSLPFIISLPTYQMPKIRYLLKSTGLKLLLFIKSAGSIIAVVILIMWGLQNTPMPNSGDKFAQIDNVQNSVYGVATNVIAPVFKPNGFGDWHFSSALVTGFLAKEVIISSMQNAYGGENEFDKTLPQTFEEASDSHGSLGAFSFMLFLLIYVPCLATLAGLRKEFGTKVAVISAVSSVLVAYVISLIFFQVGVFFV